MLDIKNISCVPIRKIAIGICTVHFLSCVYPSNIKFLVASTRQGSSKQPSVGWDERRKGPKTIQTSLLAFREDRTYLLVARTNYNSGRCIQEGINISCDTAVGLQTSFIRLIEISFSFLFYSFLPTLSWIANYDARRVCNRLADALLRVFQVLVGR